MQKIGIIGQGFVGSAVKEGMKDFFEVYTYDKDPKKESTAHDPRRKDYQQLPPTFWLIWK